MRVRAHSFHNHNNRHTNMSPRKHFTRARFMADGRGRRQRHAPFLSPHVSQPASKQVGIKNSDAKNIDEANAHRPDLTHMCGSIDKRPSVLRSTHTTHMHTHEQMSVYNAFYKHISKLKLIFRINSLGQFSPVPVPPWPASGFVAFDILEIYGPAPVTHIITRYT